MEIGVATAGMAAWVEVMVDTVAMVVECMVVAWEWEGCMAEV